jgi:hypothetical protein
MSTARQARYRQRAANAGRRQIAAWITKEATEHLSALLETGETLSALVSAAILAYWPSVTRDAPAQVTRGVTRNASAVTRNGAALAPEVKELVLGWRAEGASWGECARRLDERGILPPRGGRWLQGRGQTNLARYFRS